MCSIRHSHKNNEIAKELIKAGANLNKRTLKSGSTSLMLSILRKNDEITKELIKAGANLNAQNKRGQTALMLAKDPKIVLELINKGADVLISDEKGKTALDYANSTTREIIKKAVKEEIQKSLKLDKCRIERQYNFKKHAFKNKML